MTPYFQDESVALYRGDCREILPTLGDVDVVITDPPYQSLDCEVGTGTTTRLVGPDQISGKRLASRESGSWFATMPSAEIVAILDVCRGRLHPTGALYVFADVKSGLELFAGWARNVIVWDKQAIGMGYAWRRSHEWIAYQPMAKHQLRDKGAGDIIRCPTLSIKVHPTEKPEAVLVALILNSSDAGQIVLDPFMGSGTTGVAAKRLGRKFIGIELEERYCEIAANRLRQGALTELFA